MGPVSIGATFDEQPETLASMDNVYKIFNITFDASDVFKGDTRGPFVEYPPTEGN